MYLKIPGKQNCQTSKINAYKVGKIYKIGNAAKGAEKFVVL